MFVQVCCIQIKATAQLVPVRISKLSYTCEDRQSSPCNQCLQLLQKSQQIKKKTQMTSQELYVILLSATY